MADSQKSQSPTEGEGPQEPRKDWERLIEEQIRRAQEQGAFDNLPGKGKPLDLRRNPHLPEELELAFHVLQDAGFAPEWIELDKSIRAQLAAARASLMRSLVSRRARLAELAGRHDRVALAQRERIWADWRRAVCTFEQAVDAINRDIRDLNLKIPIARLQRFRVDAAREVARLEAERDQDEPS
jgi:DnaJ family protein C protein 28